MDEAALLRREADLFEREMALDKRERRIANREAVAENNLRLARDIRNESRREAARRFKTWARVSITVGGSLDNQEEIRTMLQSVLRVDHTG